MAKYRCIVCEFVYDEDKNDSLWMDVSDGYTCPVCGSAKKLHEKVEAEEPPATQPTKAE